MSEYTQGPWCVNHDDGETIGILGNAGNNAIGQKYVAAVQYNELEQIQYLPSIPSHNEARANARLIAAAPELLAALELVLKIVSDCHDCFNLSASEDQINFVNSAIAKAKGE